jgi:hypothetical protein
MKKFLVAAAFGATLLAAPAFAQDTPPPPGAGMAMLDKLDTNKDGAISKDEFNADVATRFAKLDTNSDGKISADERAAAGPRAGGRA